MTTMLFEAQKHTSSDVIEGVPNSNPYEQTSWSISNFTVKNSDVKTLPKFIKLLDCNRNICIPHVKKLEKSMQKSGFLAYEPVICNENGEIIDGQHRTLAAMALNIKPILEVHKGLRADSIIDVNTMSRSWGLSDFVNYYSAQGVTSFQMLQQFMEDNGDKIINVNGEVTQTVPLSATTAYCMIKQHVPSGRECANIRKGSFTCTEVEIEEGAVLWSKISPILKALPFKNLDRCTRALVMLIPHLCIMSDPLKVRYNFYDRLLELVNCYRYDSSTLHRCSGVTEYFEMFVRLYNKHLSRSKRIKIYREVF